VIVSNAAGDVEQDKKDARRAYAEKVVTVAANALLLVNSCQLGIPQFRNRGLDRAVWTPVPLCEMKQYMHGAGAGKPATPLHVIVRQSCLVCNIGSGAPAGAKASRAQYLLRASKARGSARVLEASEWLSSVSQDYLKDLHRLLILTHVAFHFHFLSHFALDHLWIADLGDLAIVLHEHSIATFVSAISVTGRLAAALTDASGIADHTRHLRGLVLLGIEQGKRSQNDREQ